MFKNNGQQNKKTIGLLKYLIVLSIILFSTFVLFACGGGGSKKISSITIEQSNISIVVGGTEQLTLAIKPTSASNTKVFFTSANSSIASVDQKGVITGISVGSTTITVTSKDGGASAVVPVEVIGEPTTLSKPTNLSFDGEKLVWNRVDNNYGYELTLNGVPYEQTLVTNFFTQYQAGVEYVVTVKALGNGKTYLTSESSDEFTFTQYVAPSIAIDSGIIQISPNSDCSTFQILLNGQTHKAKFNSTSYIIEDTLDVGLYAFEVISLGDATNNTYNSKISNTITVSKLPAPSNAEIEDQILTFNNVTGAQSYQLKIVNNETNQEVFQSVTANNGIVSYDLGEGYEAGKYKIYIKSVGDQRTTLDSAFSQEFAVDKLSQPNNVSISNGIISWDETKFATGYVMSITYDGNEILEENIPSPSFDFASKYIEAGEYSVKIMATGSEIGGVNRFINSIYSEAITITKLSAPINVGIKSNQVMWGNVENNFGYVVLLDNTVPLPLQTQNFMSLADTDLVKYTPKNYTLRVKAIGNNANILDSQYSNSFAFKKLNTIDTSSVTLNGSEVNWQGISDAMIYNVFINESTSPIVTSENRMNFSNETYLAGEYSIRIQAISTANNSLNGEKSEAITFKKLEAPSSFRVDNGILYYQMPNDASYLGYNLRIGQSEYSHIMDECLHFDQYINDDGIASVRLQAIGDGQTTLSSNFSKSISLHKISSQMNLKIENGILSWTPVNGATSYEVNVNFVGLDASTYKQTMQVEVDEPSMLNLMTTDLFSTAGNYTISIKAIGATSNIENDIITFDISSKTSFTVSTKKLEDIEQINVTNGVITWNAVQGVNFYEVVLDGVSMGDCGIMPSYVVGGSAGQHSIRVYARGNKSSVLDANNKDNTISVTKLGNVFNFKLNGTTILWDAINDAYSYDIIIRNASNEIVKQSQAIASTSYTANGLEGGQTYYVTLRANGDNDRIVSGDFGALSGLKPYEAKVLANPKNLQIVDSVLYFDYVANAKNYVLYLNYEAQQDEQTIASVEGQTRGTFDLSAYLSGKRAGTYSMFMCATDDLNNQLFISSGLTNPISVIKLKVPVFSLYEGALSYTSVADVSTYTLGIKASSESDFTDFILHRDVTKFDIDTRFSAGDYKLYIQATGDGTRTISSEKSADFEVTKLATPIASVGDNHDLEVKNGELVWNAIDNAYLYKIDVYKYDSIFGNYKPKPEYTKRLMPSTDNHYLPTGDEGLYKITIQVIGDNTKYISSDVYRYNKELDKLRAPDNLHIELGLVHWSNNSEAENGYSMVVNDTEFAVGSVISYELSGEDGFSGGMDYSIYLRTIGNSVSKLSSDLSNVLNARKLNSQNLAMKNGVVAWNYTSAEKYNILVKDLEDNEVANFETEDLEYALNQIPAGYYNVMIRDMGSLYTVDARGYLNSDFSPEFPVYKMDAPKNIRINSEFNASTDEELMRVGYLEWDEVVEALKYNLVITYNNRGESDYKTQVVDEIDVETEFYNLSAVKLIVGNYTLDVYSKGSTITNGAVAYNCVNSDRATMDAFKLSAPKNLEAKNGVFYWDTPDSVEGIEVDLQYIVYYNYANFDEEFDSTKIIPKYVGNREFQTLFDLGKYELNICATGENCIRSDVVGIEDYYLFDLFKSGSGTEDDPYLIQTYTVDVGTIKEKTYTALSQLNYINYLYDKHFKLMEDITIYNSFASLGTLDELSFFKIDKGYEFEGSIDGNGYDIIFDNGTKDDQQFGGSGSFGLLRSIGKNGKVKNLGLADFFVGGSYNNIGILSPINRGFIDNVRVINMTGGITSAFNGGNLESYVGGIVGRNYSTGTIKNSTSKIVVNATNTSTYVYAGGIVGLNEGRVENCQNVAIYLNSESKINKQINGTITGGIAGVSRGDFATIISCVNMANIDAVSNIGNYGSSMARAGGIVGKFEYTATTSANGEIVAPYVISSYNSGQVTVLENGDATQNSTPKAGGIVGYSTGGTIHSCYNVGLVYMYSKQHETATTNVGAILGWNENSEKSSVHNSFYIALEGMPLSCVIPLQTADMTKVKQEELKANITNENAVINKLNKTYNSYVYVENKYPQLSWQVV